MRIMSQQPRSVKLGPRTSDWGYWGRSSSNLDLIKGGVAKTGRALCLSFAGCLIGWRI
jgi:hypothetical protein